MANEKPAVTFRILESVLWYFWLALGPLIKRAILRLNAKAEDHVHGDTSNNLHNDH